MILVFTSQTDTFQMQAHGAEMMRLACINMIEKGIRLCMPIHDALLIEVPTTDDEEIAYYVALAQECMADASRAILNGFVLQTEAKIVKYPDRYVDERGIKTWNKIWDIIGIDTYKLSLKEKS